MDDQSSSRALPFFSKVYSPTQGLFRLYMWVTDSSIFHYSAPVHPLCVCLCVCVYMQMTNLAAADVSEEDKLKVILNQCTFDSVKWVLPDMHIQIYTIPMSVPIEQLSASISLISHMLFISFLCHSVHLSASFTYFLKLTISLPACLYCLYFSSLPFFFPRLVTIRRSVWVSQPTTPVIAVETPVTTSGTVPPVE